MNLGSLYCTNGTLEQLSAGENAFLFLEQINFSNNAMDSIDLSNFPNLKYLKCNDNRLRSLALDSNSNLRTLNCGNNDLNQLKLDNSKELHELICDSNKLKSLDLSANTKLSTVTLNSNLLDFLDIRNNNPRYVKLNTKNNPNLACISVDDVAASTAYWADDVDPSTAFSTSCKTAIDEVKIEDIILFPNPSDGHFSIKGQTDFFMLTISDVTGKTIETLQLSGNNLDVDLPNGLYFFTLTTRDYKKAVRRIVVQK